MRLFKKSRFKAKEGGEFEIFEPTINKKKGVRVSDDFMRQQRINKSGGLDRTFIREIK